MPEIKTKFKFILSALATLLLPAIASAHETYVLPKAEIAAGMRDSSLRLLDALKNSGNVRVTLVVAICSAAAVLLYFIFQVSDFGIKIDHYLKRFEAFGDVFLRLALAGSFLASAYYNSFLGPEIGLDTLPGGQYIRILLFIMGFLLALGAFTEIVGIAAYVLLAIATIVYKDYILTYYNYIGEAVALIIFGARFVSVDSFLRGPSRFVEKYRDVEIAIIRVTYGISILYPAISIKLLHPIIIVEIVNQYELNRFHWLFPHDPLLIALGTGIAQVIVGVCLIVGFETRLNTLITFVLMVMSVLFFKEAVWPHYILLALALYLCFNDGGEYSLDHYLLKK